MIGQQVKELTSETFASEISSGITLVDFWAPWCGPCLMQAPILERVAEQVGDRFKIAKVNVDEAPQLANQYQISGIPAMMIFKDGQVVRDMVGLQAEAVLLDALESTE
jgi:thioredoxin 1